MGSKKGGFAWLPVSKDETLSVQRELEPSQPQLGFAAQAPPPELSGGRVGSVGLSSDPLCFLRQSAPGQGGKEGIASALGTSCLSLPAPCPPTDIRFLLVTSSYLPLTCKCLEVTPSLIHPQSDFSTHSTSRGRRLESERGITPHILFPSPIVLDGPEDSRTSGKFPSCR